MAHELGHVIGLWHEHQRDDAPAKIMHLCNAFTDFENIVRAIERKDKSHGWEEGDTITKACFDFHVASRYQEHYPSFIATNFMPLAQRDHQGYHPMSAEIDMQSVSSQSWDHE